MISEKPKPINGLRHLALRVKHLEACVDFYTRLLGMAIEWQPDPDNIYLTSGQDNLALHRTSHQTFSEPQKLDHLGFIVNEPHQVDVWHHYLKTSQVTIQQEPKNHRDGTRSFYC